MNDITNIRSLLFTTGTEDDTEITRIEEDFINCSWLKNDPTMLALAQMYKEIALHRLIINGKNGITYDSVEQVIKRLKKFYKTKVSE